jgi:two-component system nitrogen regulation response regulator GlnG
MQSEGALTSLPVLLVDDDTELLASASRELARAGMPDALLCDDSRRVAALLERPVGVVVLDLSMPHLSGRALLSEIRASHPDVPVLVLTGRNDLEMAVECMREGARDYLVKPVEPDRLVAAVRSALEWRMQQAEIASLRHLLLAPAAGRPAAFVRVLTQNAAMLKLFRYLDTMARTPHPVLICGETGTGKELIAEAMHHASGRQGEFRSISVAGMDDATFADTVFGHARSGAGGDRGRPGLISAASNGTLFLDEVTALPEAGQARLSRLLRDGTYFQTGSDDLRRSRARILAATGADVDRAVATRAFSRELEFRFARPRAEVPPLRRRLDDLPLLVTHFVEREAKQFGKPAPHIPPALYQLLKTYDFPGNVLELERMCQHAMARHERGPTLAITTFRELIAGNGSARAAGVDPGDADRPSWIPDHLPTLREAQAALIDEAMRRAEGNQRAAAAVLGITTYALLRRLAKRRTQRDTGRAD